VGREWVIVLVIALIVVLVVMTGRRSVRGGRGSTAGHYDPDAIGRYILDPATQTYRHELPNVARTGGQMEPGTGPPHRRRRRRKRRTDMEGG
jgi:hypothetical protein